MNKKLFIPFTALILAACAPATAPSINPSVEPSNSLSSDLPNSESLPSSSSESSSTTSSTEVNPLENFLNDVRNIQQNENYSAIAYFSFVGPEERSVPYGTLEQYNKKSVYWVDENIGVLENGKKGMFEYTLNKQGNVVLGQFVNFSGGYSLGQNFETPALLMNPDKWELSYDKDCYECVDSEIVETFNSLTGVSYGASLDKTKVTYGLIRASYSGGSLIMTMNGAKGDNVYVIGTLVINKIGQTNNAKVEAFLQEEQPVTNPTSWTSAQLATIRTYFGGDNYENLPFPKGATYALNVKGLDDYSEAMITDIACGDISLSYADQLKAAGFTIADMVDNIYAYKNATKGSTNYTYEIYLTYYSNTQIKKEFGVETAKYYPQGRFQIEIMASRTTNSTLRTGSLAEFEAWLDANAHYNFPHTGWTDVVSVQYADRTETYNAIYATEGIVYQSVTSVKYFIADEQAAKNDYAAFEAKLLALGYEKTEVPEGNLVFVYFILGNYEIDLSINYNGKDYGGFIQAMYWVI